MPEYTNTEMYNLIDEWIHNARDRRIMKDRLINGIPIDGRDGMREKLEELMEEAPDEKTRQELQRLIDKM